MSTAACDVFWLILIGCLDYIDQVGLVSFSPTSGALIGARNRWLFATIEAALPTPGVLDADWFEHQAIPKLQIVQKEMVKRGVDWTVEQLDQIRENVIARAQALQDGKPLPTLLKV